MAAVRNIKNYSGIKALVQRHLDESFKLGFHSNGEQSVMMLSHQIWKLVENRTDKPILTFSYHITPWRFMGTCVTIVTDDTVSKAAIVAYDKELMDVSNEPKAQQLEYVKKRWEIATTREMIRMVLEALIRQDKPSSDLNMLQIYLDHVDLLPEDGLYFAQPVYGNTHQGGIVYCWLVQTPETTKTDQLITSKIIEIARDATRNTLFIHTHGYIVTLLCKVCEAQAKM